MRKTAHAATDKFKVGVAIVCWNNKNILPQCLDSVREQTYKKIKTVVLDNNSTDHSVELLKNHYPWVDIIKSSTNTGYAKGNNLIVKHFMRDPNIKYIALLNSDASLDKCWVEKLIQFIERHESVACVQGLTLDYYSHDIVDSTYIYINHKGQAIQAGYRQPLKDVELVNRKVFGVNAAACMVTRSFLDSQPFDDLFDEEFFMYLEDVDLAARAVVLGWNNYCVPEAIAYHMGSASSSKNPGYSVYMVNRNRLPLLFKNLPFSMIIKILPNMLVADSLELYRIARGKNYSTLKNFILGRLKGIIITSAFLKKRKVVTANSTTNHSYLWRLMKNGTVDT